MLIRSCNYGNFVNIMCFLVIFKLKFAKYIVKGNMYDKIKVVYKNISLQSAL